jgi:class 3 adenylate cyclase
MKEAETEEWASYFSAYVAPSESDTIVQPVSDFVYPIVDDTIDRAKGRHRKGSRATNSSTVGLIAVTLYWRRVIRNILPEGSLGIVMVFSMCGANFSYRIDGPNATYLGPDDFHDSSYDHLRVNSSKEFSVRNPLYSGAPVDSQYCDYMLNLYPSNVTEAQYITPDRIIFTVTVIFLFAFTSLVFCIYDITVERRQQSVLTNAVRSSNIVSSLFPSTVRARLYPTPEISSRRVGKSTKDEGYTINTAPNDEHGAHHDGSPIAELYPETTVLFADIVGFTSWSATRQPTQVFLLLETLYAAFDKIAKRRGVFKVETIGDCYVAVTGLPTPRKSHALVMARFANDCRRKMHELTVELERSLGPVSLSDPTISFHIRPPQTIHVPTLQGTADLALRIGMNSGPTTAGVLRGEKSRFQLFGDVSLMLLHHMKKADRQLHSGLA